MPAPVIFAAVAATALLYSVVCVWAYRRSRREGSPRLRRVALVLFLSSFAFVVSALQRLGLQAIRAGWLSVDVTEHLLGWWQFVQSVVLLALGVVAMVAMRPVWSGISHSERVTAALGNIEPVDVSRLTPRELEVLRAISVGMLSDKELAAHLGVSRHTAKTHVARILAKTGLHRRTELLAASAALRDLHR